VSFTRCSRGAWPGVLVAVVALAGVVSARAGEPASPPQTPQEIGPEGAVVLQGATAIEVCRLGPVLGGNKPPPEKLLAGYEILTEPSELSKPQRDRFMALFMDSETFAPYASGCGFAPEFAFRLRHEEHTLELLLSFRCDMVLARTRTADGKTVRSRLSSFRARPALLRLARELFPRDETIQSLPDMRP
jgi:hypothetical protein